MKTLRCLAGALLLCGAAVQAQISYFNQGFLRQPSAEADRNYLGISGGGAGVTNFASGDFSPLFTTSVTTPTTYPHLSFSTISQPQNLVYASPDGAAGSPLFRALTFADLPTLPSGGPVTNFAIGDLSPLFTSSVANPTFFPTVSYTLSGHAPNTVFAGPPSGFFGAPSFRFLTTADLPNITGIVRGDVSSTAPIDYNSGSGVFSMHVADLTHDGYLSSNDWSAFNAKGIGTVITMTNSGIQAANNSLVAVSNAPTLGIKSISAGANITLTDQGGTNIQINASSGGGGSSLDLSLTNLTPYANGTNYFVDFNFSTATLAATNDIAFNYSTNWGLATTGRLCRVEITPTNFLRRVYFLNASTNWSLFKSPYCIPPMRGAKFIMQVNGAGDTNVSGTLLVDDQNAGWVPQVFDLSVITASTNIGLFDASRGGVFNDHLFSTKCTDGREVRAWQDASGQGNNVTNFTTVFNGLMFLGANVAPLNIPCVQQGFSGGANTWLKSGSISKLTQPVTVFVMYRTYNSTMTIVDGATSATTARMAVQIGSGSTCTLASQNASSFSATSAYSPNYVLYTWTFNGASSSMRTNAVQMAAGSVANVTPASITVGSDINSTIPASVGYIAEIQLWWGTLNGTDLGRIETNYFRAKYRNW